MGQALKEQENKAWVDLTHYPPLLQTLGKHLLENGFNKTIKETCKKAKLNYSSVFSTIWQEKQKGNDFTKFINNIRYYYLDMASLDVDAALINGAVSGSNADRKLYYQLKGDLSDDKTNVTVNILTVAAPTPSSPIDTTARPKGVIDAEVLVPDDKD